MVNKSIVDPNKIKSRLGILKEEKKIQNDRIKKIVITSKNLSQRRTAKELK